MLLLALVGLATVIDRLNVPPTYDDTVSPAVRQLGSSADGAVALRHTEGLKNQLHLPPFFLIVLGLATVAVYRPGLVRRCKLALQKRCSFQKRGRLPKTQEAPQIQTFKVNVCKSCSPHS